MKDFIITIFGLLISGIFAIGTALPFYAAYKDAQVDEVFWAIVDIVMVFPGVIRGIMYLFGWL